MTRLCIRIDEDGTCSVGVSRDGTDWFWLFRFDSDDAPANLRHARMAMRWMRDSVTDWEWALTRNA